MDFGDTIEIDNFIFNYEHETGLIIINKHSKKEIVTITDANIIGVMCYVIMKCIEYKKEVERYKSERSNNPLISLLNIAKNEGIEINGNDYVIMVDDLMNNCVNILEFDNNGSAI